jgi:hypothetical protein
MAESWLETFAWLAIGISFVYSVYQGGYRAGLRRASEIDERVRNAINNQNK